MTNKFYQSLALLGFSATLVQFAEAKEKPNILCVVCEDISPNLGCYGDPIAKSPNLDKLATESIRFNRMYTVVGVCAPSRNALITGVYPTSIGASNMRTTKAKSTIPENIFPYDVVLPEGLICYPQMLRAAGYYCTNNFKTDYQFTPALTMWDDCSKMAHWKNRPEGKPFFSIFNIEATHEHFIWENTKKPLVVDPAKVVVPPYLMDDALTRHDLAVNYSNIYEMDQLVQKFIDEVKNAGLLDNTIIIFYSDNGGPIARGKRSLRESGTRVPFMVRFPDGYRKGEVENNLCSFVDVSATILSILGIKAPKYMQGQAFLGEYKAKPRQYVFGARSRLDEQIEKQGYVRDAKYRYIRNYMPEKSEYVPVAYRLQMPMMKALWEAHEQGKTNQVQELWFKAPRGKEEFYDVDKDPYEINNLINDPAYSKEIDRLRKAYNKWDNKYNKLWKLPETETMNLFWPNGKQPVVSSPVITKTAKGLVLKSETKGASFAYQINGKGYSKDHWFLYTDPIQIKAGDILTAVAVRPGCKDSSPATFKEQ